MSSARRDSIATCSVETILPIFPQLSRSGEDPDPKVTRLRERSSRIRHQEKITLVGNETVERLRGVETRVKTTLAQLSKETSDEIFGARQQLQAALGESASCVAIGLNRIYDSYSLLFNCLSMA